MRFSTFVPKTTFLAAALVAGYAVSHSLAADAREPQDSAAGPIVRSEFIFEQAPFASAHASTIVETVEKNEGLVAAWFGGTREGAPDVGIWVSRYDRGKTWSPPVEVATGQTDGTRHPCWNPVLFEMPDRTLALYYKVGPTPQTWWGMQLTSADGGRTWKNPQRLPDGVLGPVKNKPVALRDGSLLSGSSTETPEKPSKWRVHFERSTDGGRTWTIVRPKDGDPIDAIQPSILIHPAGRLQAVGRSRSRRVFETWSDDGGKTWGPVTLSGAAQPERRHRRRDPA